MTSAPHTMDLNVAFSTAIAAWRTGRQPSLQIISQLIDAGYDVDAIAHRHSFKAISAPSGVKDVTANAVTEATPFSLEVQVIEGEPRVLDTDLATQLEMANVYKVREIIKGHLEELEAFGEVSSRGGETGARGGRPGTAFYLNRQQALLVCILSKTEKAKAVRKEVIRRFDAYEAPTATPPLEQMMAAMTAAMTTAIAQAMQGVIQAVTAKAPATVEEKPSAKVVVPEKTRAPRAPVAEDEPAAGGRTYKPVTYKGARGKSPSYSRDDIALVLSLARRGNTDAAIMSATGLSRRVVAHLRTDPNGCSEVLRRWGR